jgi:DNA polymerase III epsilon subunit-like protein
LESKQNSWLVIDCETSGLPKYHLPADHPDQPRLASLAVILLDHDLLVEKESLFFIRPDGWSMTPGATVVNGITDAHLYQDGIPVMDVLTPYFDSIDSGRTVVGFNVRMDLKVLRGEARRAGLDDRFEKTYNVDCMHAAMPIVGLKRKNGQPKWPTLQEAYEFFYKPYQNLGAGGGAPCVYHNALFDGRCTVEIFRKLKELGALPEPKVYYAKSPGE